MTNSHFDERLREFQRILMEKLGEDENSPFASQLEHMINKRGPLVASEAYRLAVARYESGDMISDGSRRRTLGGCFVREWKAARRIVKAREKQPQ